MFRQVATLFLDVGGRLTLQISQAICDRDGAALARAAHTLSGSADVLAARQVSRTALQMERLARAGQFEAAAALVPDLEVDLRQLFSSLQTVLDPEGCAPTCPKDPAR
jgi:HPt (histidine-containing phosphotransfer) domain-containing protein